MDFLYQPSQELSRVIMYTITLSNAVVLTQEVAHKLKQETDSKSSIAMMFALSDEREGEV